MDPPLGVDASPAGEPESRPPDEAEAVIRAASPWRLVGRITLALFALGAAAGGAWALRHHSKRLHARRAPMVSIPAGTFRMGKEYGPVDEMPAHEVTLGPFQIDVTEVTVAAYGLCVEEGRCTPPIKHESCNWGKGDRDEHPINCVDWFQANAFCEWARKRLPTEEEWEYAARAGRGQKYPWGDAPPGPTLLNVCDGECRRMTVKITGKDPPVMYDESDGWGATAPVGSFPAGDSPFGIKDLAGNVWEWTSSAYCLYGTGGCSDPRKVSRGGGWSNAYRPNVESTTRAADAPSAWSDGLGFRCAR